MTSISGFFGFPSIQKRDSVRFYFAKSLPYTLRITLTLVLLAAGFILQIYYMKLSYGIPFLLIGIGLVLVKGYDSRVRLKSFQIDPHWQNVTIDKVRELDEMRNRIKRWDRSALDISNPLGTFTFLFIGALVLIGAFILGAMSDNFTVALILVVDASLVLIPLWFSGMRFILKQPNLAIRVKLILNLYAEFQRLKKEGEEFKPALMLSRGKEGKTVPIDARFSIGFPAPPEGFYGLQAQINLNIVQGASYPYFYCVLAAKPGFDLRQFQEKINLAPNVICEYQEDSKAEVLVIRQYTTRKSGYHTKDRQSVGILRTALEGGRSICAKTTA
ncbi:MAG: hypothetical protein JW755_04275 [Candidatus Aminicenantes bacterium]|nr:hypothetical protein [Candidatus Aminicenantes bacterium]